MYRRTIITIVVATALLAPEFACGPNCQKIITTKKPEDLAYDDSVRINGLVERRKAAIETAKGGNMYVIEDAKATVTACEMAIEFQLQIGNLAKEGNALYEEHQKKINEARCFLDEVLASKGKLIGTGKAAFISGGHVRKIREYHETFKSLFGKEGGVSERRLVDTYTKGIKAKKAEPEKIKEDNEGEAGEAPKASGEESAGAEASEDKEDWGEVSDEKEGGEDEGEKSDSMDAF